MGIRVTVWNEFRHEKDTDHKASDVYPDGIHTVIASFLNAAGYDASTATLDEPEHGLTDEVIANTDVFVWWGHMAHHEVDDEIVAKVKERILAGAGLVALHSGHFSKIFKSLMGTTCNLKWREAGEKERIWVVNPGHPIVDGIGPFFELESEEMYGEHFDIPQPDELVFVSWFAGGEIFRSGCCFTRGAGKIFYFQPGHETNPTYYNETIQKVIVNGVKWAAPIDVPAIVFGNFNPIEPIEGYVNKEYGQDY
ncbi:MAG: ThuA domain-containing protein [Thermomicrobiales bacterium]|nr:ThuA domain-containing protein [Thermomicrobiales bacterium]